MRGETGFGSAFEQTVKEVGKTVEELIQSRMEQGFQNGTESIKEASETK